MILRPVTALAAVCTLSLFALPAMRTQADNFAPTSPSASNNIQISVDPEASEAAGDATAPTLPSATRHFHRSAHRSAHHSTVRTSGRVQSLPSRGMAERAGVADSAAGRLAIVTSDSASIVAGRDRAGRVLSVCPKGQYLAISGETPTEYAVLMIDRSVGFVAKSDVQILDYQVAPAPSASDPSAAQSAPAPTQDGLTLGQRLVQTAQTYLGVPYVWGGNTAAGIDCSGFVKAVYSTYGITLPRHSGDQAAIGYDVPHHVASGDWSQWVPGDRMYFACHHPEIDHTGMYIGGGLFIHASAGHGHQVAIDRVDNAYYSGHLVCVRRSPQLLGEPVTPGDFRRTASATTTLDAEANQR